MLSPLRKQCGIRDQPKLVIVASATVEKLIPRVPIASTVPPVVPVMKMERWLPPEPKLTKEVADEKVKVLVAPKPEPATIQRPLLVPEAVSAVVKLIVSFPESVPKK